MTEIEKLAKDEAWPEWAGWIFLVAAVVMGLALVVHMIRGNAVAAAGYAAGFSGNLLVYYGISQHNLNIKFAKELETLIKAQR